MLLTRCLTVFIMIVFCQSKIIRSSYNQNLQFFSKQFIQEVRIVNEILKIQKIQLRKQEQQQHNLSKINKWQFKVKDYELPKFIQNHINQKSNKQQQNITKVVQKQKKQPIEKKKQQSENNQILKTEKKNFKLQCQKIETKKTISQDVCHGTENCKNLLKKYKKECQYTIWKYNIE